jgi:hypothetical protein
MQSVIPLRALDLACTAINQEQKQTAFEIAARVVISDRTLTEEDKRILHTIVSELPVDRRFAKKTIENVTLKQKRTSVQNLLLC